MREVNTNSWRGTEISVTIGGNWGNYRARILQYFQQLAVITVRPAIVCDTIILLLLLLSS